MRLPVPAVGRLRGRRGVPAPRAGLDPLTGLPARSALVAHLRRATAPVTLLCVDIDDFRRVNAEAGQRTGDDVLVSVAGTLRNLVGEAGVALRLHGDDFAVLVPAAGPSAAHQLAEQIQHQVSRPVVVGDRRLHLRANVGVVLDHPVTPAEADGPTDAVVEDLLRCADVALALAQRHPGGLAVHSWSDCRAVPPEQLLQGVADLHTALAPGGTELALHFQPQLELLPSAPGTAVHSCEALVRWHHPARGTLGPGTILRIAAVAHLHRALGARILDLALAAAATWWPQHPRPVSVNLEAEDLDHPGFPDEVARALERYGLPAAALTLEVVEGTLMADPVRAAATLQALREQGCTVAIDDFGTGYSSLAWLHRLPIDVVKFDRSIVAGLAADRAATAVVRHSTRLAHDLGLVVVAEGVESEDDLALLRDLECDRVQGFLTGRPVPVDQWTALLRSETST
ncbi:putative bifunctional diguanylate cyclase/phosphodiesterase [Klenkia brasiliensis]|uniref:Diguanylate cyclase (GGDEF) domain-containing protein n=1 Tax=Klenkia brasiliensis TaxID=333142 RepID=A0A1G7Q7C5_9ACTN|nr:bifunctional diguanylate cyclase/phosphodiesterase [Klenkia brasiliensis]SDF93829.1 diguanylate cyclase (GGDEF) domain-containing protein [Klenkia brasiliensis]